MGLSFAVNHECDHNLSARCTVVAVSSVRTVPGGVTNKYCVYLCANACDSALCVARRALVRVFVLMCVTSERCVLHSIFSAIADRALLCLFTLPILPLSSVQRRVSDIFLVVQTYTVTEFATKHVYNDRRSGY